MNRTIARAAVIATVAGGLNLAALAPADAQVVGRRCSLTTKGGITQMTGGPLIADAVGAAISMRCTLQLGTANSTHADADAAVVNSLPSTQVAAIPPTPVSVAIDNQKAYVCTQATVGTTTYYLDDVAGTWSTSNTVACGSAIDNRRVLQVADELFSDVNGVLLLLDPLICSVLVELAPGVPGIVDIMSDGDVYIVGEFIWDCPPYV